MAFGRKHRMERGLAHMGTHWEVEQHEVKYVGSESLHCPYCVTLGRLLNLSVPHFQNEMNIQKSLS